MVDKEGNAKIMDFGIARSLRAAGMTAEGMIIGTPEYMAPEQVEGLEADQRTDIYALGAILFEMVTGRVPFEGDSPLSVAYKHKNEPPVPPRKLNAQVPEPLEQLNPPLPGERKRQSLSKRRRSPGRPRPDRGRPSHLRADPPQSPPHHPYHPGKAHRHQAIPRPRPCLSRSRGRRGHLLAFRPPKRRTRHARELHRRYQLRKPNRRQGVR